MQQAKNIEIEVSCNPAVPGCEGGRVRFQPEQWMLNPEDTACTGGASVTLSENAPLEGEYVLRYSGIFR